MLRAKDIMTINPIALKKETPAYEAVKNLVENNITCLPIVDDDMTLVGIVSQKDLLEVMYNEDKPGNVEDFMTKNVFSFNQEISLIDIAECFIKNHFRKVPIVSEGKLVGVVDKMDIIEYILKLRCTDENAE